MWKYLNEKKRIPENQIATGQKPDKA